MGATVSGGGATILSFMNLNKIIVGALVVTATGALLFQHYTNRRLASENERLRKAVAQMETAESPQPAQDEDAAELARLRNERN